MNFHLLIKRFTKIAKKGILTSDTFRDSLGLLGLEPASFLSDRIFAVIDEDCDGVVSFDDYLKYLNTLINGCDKDKANLSFKIIDKGNKGKINYKDIENMILGISSLWNSLTDSEVVPKKEYVDYIFKTFDLKNAGEISFYE